MRHTPKSIAARKTSIPPQSGDWSGAPGSCGGGTWPMATIPGIAANAGITSMAASNKRDRVNVLFKFMIAVGK